MLDKEKCGFLVECTCGPSSATSLVPLRHHLSVLSGFHTNLGFWEKDRWPLICLKQKLVDAGSMCV